MSLDFRVPDFLYALMFLKRWSRRASSGISPGEEQTARGALTAIAVSIVISIVFPQSLIISPPFLKGDTGGLSILP
jgi:hypothetical protein